MVLTVVFLHATRFVMKHFELLGVRVMGRGGRRKQRDILLYKLQYPVFLPFPISFISGLCLPTSRFLAWDRQTVLLKCDRFRSLHWTR